MTDVDDGHTLGSLRATKPKYRGTVCLLLSVFVVVGCAPSDVPPKRIVLIVVDTLRRDHLSPYGSELPTPNIERLAEAGQVFTNVNASFHQTTMSMGALFTGRTPSIESEGPASTLAWMGRSWCGMARFFAGPEDTCVPQGLSTLAERLHDAGYWTLGAVSNRLLFAPSGYEQGFDSWIEVGTKRADLPRTILSAARSGERVYSAVEEATREIPDGPLFLYVHYMDVHDYKLNFPSYAAAVVHQDAQFGRLMKLLEERGLLEDAVVFLTSDHGEIVGEKHKGYLSMSHLGNPSFQPVLEIPLIVAPPRFEQTDRFLRSQDIGGLILQVAGASPIADATPLLDPNELFLTEFAFLTYRKGRFKSTLHRKKIGKWALYDLQNDPAEQTNLISTKTEIGVEHVRRAKMLAEKLATTPLGSTELSEEDAARLKALGYLE